MTDSTGNKSLLILSEGASEQCDNHDGFLARRRFFIVHVSLQLRPFYIALNKILFAFMLAGLVVPFKLL